MSLKRVITGVVVILVCALIASCGGDSGFGIGGITSLSVSPGTSTLETIGDTVQLSAIATGGIGAISATFLWSSSDAAVASVSDEGLVTAVSNGTATITVEASGTILSATATVTVGQPAGR